LVISSLGYEQGTSISNSETLFRMDGKMREKIVDMLYDNHAYPLSLSETIADELHAMRYEVARQVYMEFKNETWEVDVDMGFINWLAEQGETITIDLLRRDK